MGKRKKMERRLELERRNKIRLIEKSGSISCPLSKEILKVNESIALQINHKDFIVSLKGFEMLSDKYGKEFMNARKIYWY